MLAWLSALALAVPQPELRLHLGKVPMKGRVICYPSGLEVHAVQRPNTGVVAVGMVIEGGMVAEQAGERGAAHLAEHLWDRAPALGGVPVAETLSGLVHDARTLPDAAVWVTLGTPDDLRYLLDLEGRRLADPLRELDPAVFEAERARVHNETVWRGEHAARRATRELEDGMWPSGFPYRGLTARVEESDALTLDAVRAYVERTWVPSATTIRVEGEIDLANIDSVLEQAIPVQLRLGEERGNCLRPALGGDPPAPAGGPPMEISAGVLEPEVLFGWSLPSGYGDSDVIGRAAAGWMSIRLGRDLAARGLAIGCAYEPRRRASVLLCRSPRPDTLRADEAIAAVSEALRDLWVGDLTERPEWVEELVGALDGALLAADAYDTDALMDRALFSHYGGTAFDSMTAGLDAVLGFEESSLVDYGRRHLTASRMVAVSVVPAQVPAEERSGRIEALAGLGAPKAGPWAVPAPRFEGWTTRQLDNGLQVWLVPRSGGAPLSVAGLAFRGGDSVGVPGAAQTQVERWTTRLPLSFATLVDATATAAHTAVGAVETRVDALGPSGNLDAQLYLVNQLALSPTFGAAGSEVGTRAVDPADRAAQDRLARLFPDHPLARGTAAVGARRKDAADWRRGVLRPERAALAVVGWVDAADAEELARAYFGAWRAPKGDALVLPPPPLPAERGLRGVEASSSLASVHVACRLPPRNGENDAAIDVATFLLDEGMDQSLRTNGGTYLADARAEDLGSAGGLLELRTAVGPDEAADALSAMYGLVEIVSAGPPDDVLQWARRGVLARYAQTLASTRTTADLVLRSAAEGLTLDDLRSYPVRVGLVDGEAVRHALAGCMGFEAATYVGPKVDLSPYEPTWLP